MAGEDIKKRCETLCERVIRLAKHLPTDYPSQVIGHQIVRSSSSVGANYHAASRPKSRTDFINKLKIVEEELDETIYWMELIVRLNLVSSDRMQPLIDESNELLAIIVASILTARRNERLKRKNQNK